MCDYVFLRNYALVFARLPDEFKVSELEELAGVLYISVYNYTRLYRRLGLIENAGRGRWRLTEKGKEMRDAIRRILGLCEELYARTSQVE